MDGQTWNCAATDEESFSRFETNDEGFMSGAKLFGATSDSSPLVLPRI